MREGLNQLSDLLASVYHVDITRFDDAFFFKALDRRMIIARSEALVDYMKLLSISPSESTALMDSLNINYSEFFRNPLTYSFLEQVVLPALMEKKVKGNEKEIRIWSAACAAGQEPYSIAILMDEALRERESPLNVRIFATDIDHDELENARTGHYLPPAMNKVSFRRLQEYFEFSGSQYTVSSRIRAYVDFSDFDLLGEECTCPPASIYGNFDMIFCCNLLFYYKPEYRQRIIRKLSHSLAPGGYIVTGVTERDIVRENEFHEIFPYSSIFQKNL